jgi:ATP-dependent DNA helicase RecG
MEGHKYGRDGESLGPLTDNEYDTIKSQRSTVDWIILKSLSATIDDLSHETIKQARLRYAEKYGLKRGETWTDEVFLNKAKITIKIGITKTAIYFR